MTGRERPDTYTQILITAEVAIRMPPETCKLPVETWEVVWEANAIL